MANIRILVIEDDLKLNRNLCGILQEKGYDVQAARSERKAEQKLRKSGVAIGIALVDMSLPVKVGLPDDGEAGLRLITLMTERYPWIITIVYTGHGAIGNASRCMEAGAFSYCPKGGDPEETVGTIKKAEAKYKKAQPYWKTIREMEKKIDRIRNDLINVTGTLDRLPDQLADMQREVGPSPEGTDSRP